MARRTKVVAIIQARMNSSRLPGKVLAKINGKPLIEILLRRLSRAKEIDQILIATSLNESDNPLVKTVENLGYKCFRGDEKNVLDRYIKASEFSKAETIVRITGDCPMVDAKLVDKAIRMFHDKRADYLSNTEPPTFPDGLDIEVFTRKSLITAYQNYRSAEDSEHVTPFIRETELFRRESFHYHKDVSQIRLCVDEAIDLEVVQEIFSKFDPDIHFNLKKILSYKYENPELFLKNAKIQRNEGRDMNTGQKLWKRAKRIIPGGNMLLSKRAEMFHPANWPVYFSKAKGCKVWDLDGQRFIDMSLMGVGTNTLGYGNAQVDRSVLEAIKKGNLSTLNCPEEVSLAERLVEMHPWASMVRLARTGGEANSIAVRIARASSGRQCIAVCGYHGWHDWYLAANLRGKDNLSGHLLPGLEPKGVPEVLNNTIFPFEYNNFKRLKDIISQHDIGVIKMEVQRNEVPRNNFLEKVRALATKNNIVLIFDECTSGFRETFGGLHLKHNVSPDIAVFGKTLGNGYAISAIIGTRSVMESAQSSFISSTFWTERIGPSAALKTLQIMEQEKSWEIITQIGERIKENWLNISQNFKLDIECAGLPALASFSFKGKDSLLYKTYLTQEFLKKGILASNSIYASTEHKSKHLETYFGHLEKIFATIRMCQSERQDINSLIEGPQCHDGFKRLN